jgi:dienelactone hydrolase
MPAGDGRRLVIVLGVALLALAASTTWHAPVEVGGKKLEVEFAKPESPRVPALLVVFATGDAGWMGASGDVFDHLADNGYYVAGYDSKAVVRHVKGTGGTRTIPKAAAAIDELITRSKETLGLPPATPVIVTGFSRGANFVVLAAGAKALQRDVAGAVAMSLTRETDFLDAPPAAERPPELQIDDKGRIQTYPAIALAGPIPFAVIQADGDKYVGAAEARRLFGPDTSTRRLYEVKSTSHGFGGARDELLHDLDDALGWIQQADNAATKRPQE